MQYLPLLVKPAYISISLIVAFLAVVFALLAFKFGRLYVNSLSSNAHVSLFQMVGMALRRVDAQSIVEYRIMARKAGIDIAPSSLESHHLAGGNVKNVVRALIAAGKANIDLGFDHACAIDLAGRDVFDAVKTCINPKVVACPDPTKGRDTLDAVTKDGIQIKVKARITIRTNIKRLIGGASEDTVVSHVGEGVISAIGSMETYKKALETPDAISRTVMDKKFDADTAFEILSINVVDVSVGDNVGAKLQADQADADKRIAQADAEKRQGAAAAREQEMKAVTEESKAKALAAEAEVSRAVAQAFREGNLGVMDYYHMKNVQADTAMRSSLAKPEVPHLPR